MKIRIMNAAPSNANDISSINSLTWFHTYKSKKYGITKKIIDKDETSVNQRELYISKKYNEIQKSPGSYILAKDKDKVVGYACGKIKSDEKFNEFFAIYILPEYHGKGIGKLLAKKVFEYLGPHKDIIVKVVGYNKNAINFYKSLGFEKNLDLNSFEILKGVYVPEIQMKLKKTRTH